MRGSGGGVRPNCRSWKRPMTPTAALEEPWDVGRKPVSGSMANVDQTGLNDSHKRRIAAVLTSVEELLEQIEAAAAAGESKSPFSSTHQDLTPTQQQVVRDYVARLRSVLTSTVPLLGSHGGRRSTAASWAIQTNLRFVAIAAEELGPSFLRGYGAVEEIGR